MEWQNLIVIKGLIIGFFLILIVVIIPIYYKKKLGKINIEFFGGIIKKDNYYIGADLNKDLSGKMNFLFSKDIELNKVNIDYKITFFAHLGKYSKDELIFKYNYEKDINKTFLNGDLFELDFYLDKTFLKEGIEKEFRKLSFISKNFFKNYNFRKLTIKFVFDIKGIDFEHKYYVFFKDNQISDYLKSISNKKYKSKVKINKYGEYEAINKNDNEDFFEENGAVV